MASLGQNELNVYSDIRPGNNVGPNDYIGLI